MIEQELHHRIRALMSGTSMAAVSKHLRHTDPKITMDRHGHLTPGYMQEEIDKLSFGLSFAADLSTRVAANWPQGDETSDLQAETGVGKTGDGAGFEWSGQWDSNSRPPAPKGAECGIQAVTADDSTPQLVEKTQAELAEGFQGVQPVTAIRSAFVARLSPDSSAVADDGWLTVREVAGRLSVSTATVYKLIGRGLIEHARVSNAIRVNEGALARYLQMHS